MAESDEPGDGVGRRPRARAHPERPSSPSDPILEYSVVDMSQTQQAVSPGLISTAVARMDRCGCWAESGDEGRVEGAGGELAPWAPPPRHTPPRLHHRFPSTSASDFELFRYHLIPHGHVLDCPVNMAHYVAPTVRPPSELTSTLCPPPAALAISPLSASRKASLRSRSHSVRVSRAPRCCSALASGVSPTSGQSGPLRELRRRASE